MIPAERRDEATRGLELLKEGVEIWERILADHPDALSFMGRESVASISGGVAYLAHAAPSDADLPT